MNRIVLLDLTFRNFKGIRDFRLTTDGENAEVFGDNGAGKTTLFDGFIWLLFDKDSQNKKDFAIKEMDKAGNVLHGFEHEVEGIFLINNRRRTLRKVFSEKWTKKRGSASQEFTGHTTDYFIDGVPSKKSEYDTFVNGMVQEDIFKLLTSPTYFNEVLKKDDRRKALLDVCGDLSDGEVIASADALRDLPSILGDRSIEDHRKVIAARRVEINKELDKIPVRIDEVHRSMPALPETDEQACGARVADLNRQMEAKQAEASRIKSGGEVSVREKLLREAEGELLQIRNELQQETMNQLSRERQNLSQLKTEYNQLNRKCSDLAWSIDRNNKIIADRQREASDLRNQWHSVSGEAYEAHHSDNCPACGQSLPEDQIKAAHDKALGEFNRRRAGRLEEITIKGKAAAGEANRLQAENERLCHEQKVTESTMHNQDQAIQAAEARINTLQAGMVDVDSIPRYQAKKSEIEFIRYEITGLQSSVQDNLDRVNQELFELRRAKDQEELQFAKFAQAKQARERITALEAQEKKLAAEYEKLEHELYLTEEFIRTKVTLLETKINSRFKMARFKLFEPQINGGLAEVCEATYNGVPYGSGLNNAARINVGLDIINTLSEHYRFSAPIFIDNAEAVTQLIDTVGQKIQLVVSGSDKALRVEKSGQKLREAI